MGKFSCYLKSARLRTLPLSLAGIVTGVGLAAADYRIDALTATLVALTAICLQILSNVSNEYGDYIHGTDRDDRQGPRYSFGQITDKDYKRMVIFWVAASCVSGLAMIWRSYGTLMQLEPVMILILGVFAITAAMRYTLGNHPYGYSGHGDIAVFIFFGLVTVLGSYFIVAHEIPSWYLILPASAIGLFSVGVLNVNNLRDIKTDAETRITMAIRLGVRKAKIYQGLLICGGWAMMVIYVFGCRIFDWWHLLFVITLPLFVIHLSGVRRKNDAELDKYLPMLVMGTFLMSICIAIGFNAYRWF
ncbi:MAG: 1,4-dihydroxy-2-naphthoate octaprenyltransferase [Candidatus Cryptobacteroides sp.]